MTIHSRIDRNSPQHYHKPAGHDIVQVFNPSTQICDVLYQYPGKKKPESIPISSYRLIPQGAVKFIQ